MSVWSVAEIVSSLNAAPILGAVLPRMHQRMARERRECGMPGSTLHRLGLGRWRVILPKSPAQACSLNPVRAGAVRSLNSILPCRATRLVRQAQRVVGICCVKSSTAFLRLVENYVEAEESRTGHTPPRCMSDRGTRSSSRTRLSCLSRCTILDYSS